MANIGMAPSFNLLNVYTTIFSAIND